jgi:hypothetical protein
VLYFSILLISLRTGANFDPFDVSLGQLDLSVICKRENSSMFNDPKNEDLIGPVYIEWGRLLVGECGGAQLEGNLLCSILLAPLLPTPTQLPH